MRCCAHRALAARYLACASRGGSPALWWSSRRVAAHGAVQDSRAQNEKDNSAIARIRNVGIVAHIDAGKTTTTERMLYYAGVLKRVGEVDSGTTTTDFMKEEIDRGITIQSAAVSFPWHDHAVTLIDTPGHADFTIEVERAMRVVDGVVALFDASAGVQAQSYTVLQQSKRCGIPMLAFLNKLDKDGADFTAAVSSIKDKLQVEPMVLQLPLRTEYGAFVGVVDVITQQALRFSGRHGEQAVARGLSATADHEDAHVMEAARRGRHELINVLTAHDDALAEALIALLEAVEGDEAAAEARLSPDELRQAVRRLTLRQSPHVPLVPVVCGASRRNTGVQPLLDAMVAYLPSPQDRVVHGYTRDHAVVELPPARVGPAVPAVALVFKVVHVVGRDGERRPLAFIRVYSGRLRPRTVVYNRSRGEREVLAELYERRADTQEAVPSLSAGQIGTTFLQKAYTGDTLYAPALEASRRGGSHAGPPADDDRFFTLEGIETPPAVLALSIEAATRQQLPVLEEALQELHREDPSFSFARGELGQLVVRGMGTLHLEIMMSRLTHEYRLACRLLRAIVEYRETVRAPHALQNAVGMLNELPYMECSLELRPLLRDDMTCSARDECAFQIDQDFARTYLASARDGGGRSRGDAGARAGDRRSVAEELRLLQACFTAAVGECSRLGPLAGLPMHGFLVVLTSIRSVSGTALQERAMKQIARSLVLQLLQSVDKEALAVLEPMMELTIALSDPSYVGGVVRSLNERRAATVDVQEGGRAVRAVVAMRNIMRYTMELRRVVKGHATQSSRLDHYRVVDDQAVLRRIFKNLGLAE